MIKGKIVKHKQTYNFVEIHFSWKPLDFYKINQNLEGLKGGKLLSTNFHENLSIFEHA